MSIGNCINRNSKEYKDKLAENNGDQAATDKYFNYADEAELLFDMSSVMEEGATIDQTEIKENKDISAEQKIEIQSLVEKIEVELKKQLSALSGQKFKSKEKELFTLKTTLEKLKVEKVNEDIDTIQQIKSLEIFVDDTLRKFRLLNKDFQDWIKLSAKPDLSDTQKKNLIKDFSLILTRINNYTILDAIDKADIDNFFKGDKNTISQMGIDINKMTPQARITESIAIRDKMKKDLNKSAIPLLASFILKYKPEYGNAKILDQIEAIDKRIEDTRNYPKNKPEYIAKRVNELEATKNKLLGFTLDEKTLIDQLTSTNIDESFFNYLVDPLISSEDNVIALFAKAIKSEMETARLQDIKIKNDLFKNYLEPYFKTYSRATSIKNLYSGIYEEIDTFKKNVDYDENVKDSETYLKTTRLAFVQKYDINKYNTERYKFFKDLGKKPTEAVALAAYKKKKKDWYKANTQKVDQSIIDAAIAEKQNDLVQGFIDADTFNNWASSIDFNSEFIRPADKYLNKNWTNLYDANGKPKNEKGRLHEGLTKLYFEQQEKLPSSKRPGYFVPSIPKSTNERLQTNVIKGAKQTFKETFNVQNYEDDFGNLSESSAIAGEGNKNLPIYFISEMSTDIVSYDLGASVLQFSAMSNKFDALNKIHAEINLFKFAIGDRVVEKTDSSGQNILDSFAKKLGYNLPIISKGQFDNNSKAHVNAFIDMIIFGEAQQVSSFEAFGAKFDSGKLTNLGIAYSALTSIAGDLLKGIANNLQGNIQLIIEANSGEFFTKKNLLSAKGNFMTDTPAALGDFFQGNVAPKSFQGRLVELFEPMQGDFTDEYGKVVSASVARKLFSTNTLFFNQHWGEYEIAVSNMYALMHGTKVYDIESKTIIDLYEAYKKYINSPEGTNLEGKVEIVILDAYNAPIMEGTEYKTLPFTDARRQDFQNRLHALSKRMQGIYNKFDKGTFQKYSIGRLILMYRKHMVPGFKRRFKKLSYDIELDSMTEGFYRVFHATVLKDLKKLKFNLIKNWSTYSAFEKASIKKVIMEISIILSLLLVLSLLTGDDDDDEKGYFTQLFVYELTRMRSETAAYINLNDAYRNVRSPSAMLTSVDRVRKFVTQVMPWNITEVYERKSGVVEKGDNKAWVYFKRMMGFSGYNFNPEEATKLYKSISEL